MYQLLKFTSKEQFCKFFFLLKLFNNILLKSQFSFGGIDNYIFLPFSDYWFSFRIFIFQDHNENMNFHSLPQNKIFFTGWVFLVYCSWLSYYWVCDRLESNHLDQIFIKNWWIFCLLIPKSSANILLVSYDLASILLLWLDSTHLCSKSNH